MSKQCDNCHKDICDCKLASKHYDRGYQQGRADFAEWICTKYLDKNTNILCIEELGGADDLLEEYIKSVK